MRSYYHAALRSVACLFFVVAASLPALAQTQASTHKTPSATIIVRADQTVGQVNPFVFGANIGGAADSRGIFTLPLDAPQPKINNGQGTWNPKTNAPYPTVLTQITALNIGMLRYPGGCLTHNYDWRDAVGPLDKRPNWKFGLDQYLELCRDLGAEPLITVSMYVLPADQIPAHLAAMVEYLNAPATPDHPWAMKRAKWGHPKPYGVKYFELGNEVNHGNHHVIPHRVFTAKAYAQCAIATAKAMKAVDPSIKLGLVTPPGNGQNYDDPWNTTVFDMAGQYVDFTIVHMYTPHVSKNSTPETVAAACMAVNDQLEAYLHDFHRVVKQASGRDLPIAVTEFNISAVQEKPIPYRFSYAAALKCADFYRVALEPSSHILATNYWQLLNGYWGTFYTNGDKITKVHPAYPLFKMWGQHFGRELCRASVVSPLAEFAGGEGIRPAMKAGSEAAGSFKPVKIGKLSLKGFRGEHLSASLQLGGTLVVDLKNVTAPQYCLVARVSRPKSGGKGALEYNLSYEGRWMPSGANPTRNVMLGMDMTDGRGWDATHSGIAVTGVQASSQWQTYSGNYRASNKTPGVILKVRAVGASPENPITGRLEIRNVRLKARHGRAFGAYPVVTSSASLSEDGDKLYVIVFNKSLTQNIKTTLNIEGFDAASARYWEIAAKPMAIKDVHQTATNQPLTVSGDAIVHTFPALSMTAIELTKGSDGTAQTANKKTDDEIYRVLFLGNSITRHHKAPKLGWNHVSGMAASSESKDYVHVFTRRLQEAMPDKHVVPVTGKLTAVSTYDLASLDAYRQPGHRPDLVIVQTGEDDHPGKVSESEFRTDYENVIRAILALPGSPRLICLGVWSPVKGPTYGPGWAGTMNRTIQALCNRYNVPFASVVDIATNPANHGSGKVPGVRWHPNDRGHAGYAQRLFETWQKSPRTEAK